ncbi:MAG: folate-binding protein [Pseudomonadota bacterium]
MPLVTDPSRVVLKTAGPDAKSFLQGLLTNDVGRAAPDRAVYAALLTPQGKFLFDALVSAPEPDVFLLDTAADRAEAFLKRLTVYKLRSAVEIAPLSGVEVALAWDGEQPPADALARYDDPRDPSLGRRGIAPIGSAPHDPGLLAAHDALRIAAGVPLAGAELLPDATFPLEAGFERAQGVDFKKGCFVGQEIVARMKHKTELKKRLYRVRVEGAAPAPGETIAADGKPAGVMGSSRDGHGLAVLRADRIGAATLTAGEATLTVLE